MWLAFNANTESIPLPCHIKLTRLSSRSLDDDNLLFAFKSIRDYIADKLIPGLQIGRADGDKRITWEYAQETEKKQAVKIEIYNP